WADTAWTTNHVSGQDIAPTAICCRFHTGDGSIVVAFDATNGAGTAVDGISIISLAAGGGSLGENIISDTPGYSARWVNMGLVRTAEDTYVIVAEMAEVTLGDLGAPWAYFHAVFACEYRIDSMEQSSQPQVTRHANMLSQPWAYVGGRSLTNARTEVYCALGFKSTSEPQNWQQAYGFIVNLDYDIWDTFDTSYPELPVRARPICNLTTPGIINSAPSGYSPAPGAALIGQAPCRRMCHLPAICEGPPFGPEVKTRSFAGNVYQRSSAQSVTGYGSVVSELLPTNAAVVEFVAHMEDPWVMFRDNSDPLQPDRNFRHPYSRSMHQTAKAGAGLFVSGGTPQMYDGRQMVECGFPWNPEVIGTVEDTSQGDLTPGTRFLYVVARWRDGAVVHRSAPSNIIAFTTEGETNSSFNFLIRTQTMSLKDSLGHFVNVQAIEFEVFATVSGGGQLFYRVFGSGDWASNYKQEDVPVNYPTDYLVAFKHGVSDTNLVAQGLGPYQFQDDANGGAAAGFSTLTPVVVPALTCVTEWQNRVVGVSAQDGLIWYSSEMAPEAGGELLMAPEFNPARTYRANIGEITAIKAMAETLYVWTRDTIYALTGAPQSDSTIADATLQLIVIQEGIGCVDPLSLVLAPDGIFFRSQKGYYLLGRGRNVAPAGLDAARYMARAGNIRNATDFENRHQIRLTCDDAPIRTYTTVLTPTIVGTPEGTWSFTPTGLQSASTLASAGWNLAFLLTAMAGTINARVTDGTYADIISAAVVVGSTVVVQWLPDVFPDFALAFPVGDNLTGATDSEVEIRPLVLIYDYLRQVWTTRPLLPLQSGDFVRAASVASACAWEGSDGELLHVVLQQCGLLIERETTDDDAFMDSHPSGFPFGVPIRLRTSWIHVAGYAGAMRIRSGAIQAAKPNVSQYHVDMGFTFDGDYDNPTVEEDLTITVSPPHMRVRPRYQKCVAFYIEVYEDSPGATENVRILGLAAELGIEGGAFRPPAAQVAT
ncbi:MAG: hypothetical protein WC052_05940, partial [Patescibacteria group bacterium]